MTRRPLLTLPKRQPLASLAEQFRAEFAAPQPDLRPQRPQADAARERADDLPDTDASMPMGSASDAPKQRAGP